jgi:2-iminobutanoate/2-iminopropanoate deaminase
MKHEISTRSAPTAIGPYAQAISDGEWLFCSGQLGIDSATGRMVDGGAGAETRRAMENLREVLRAAGLSFDDIVKTTIYVADLKDFDTINRIYGEHLSSPYPARSTVQVAALPRGARIEIEAIARQRK